MTQPVTEYMYRTRVGTFGGTVAESTHASIVKYNQILGVATILRWVRRYPNLAECMHCAAKNRGRPDEMRTWARAHYCPEVSP